LSACLPVSLLPRASSILEKERWVSFAAADAEDSTHPMRRLQQGTFHTEKESFTLLKSAIDFSELRFLLHFLGFPLLLAYRLRHLQQNTDLIQLPLKTE
jgi:hypothetical protein